MLLCFDALYTIFMMREQSDDDQTASPLQK
jgi:hypothetical protein